MLDRIRERFQACNLELHPGKDTDRVLQGHPIRTEANPDIQFTFLGYATFRPRKAVDKYGRVYVNFSPAVQPRRPQGHAADNPGVAGPTEERQERG